MVEHEWNSLDRLAEIVREPKSDSYIEELVETAREHLGLDIAYVSEFVDGHQVFGVVEGDGSSYGIEEGGSVPLTQTYCSRMVAGKIPSLILDAQKEEGVRFLGATTERDIGTYVGVPIRLSDGRVYGTFCSISHAPAPHLRERDLAFIHVLARLVGSFVEQQRTARDNARLAVEAAGMEALAAALEARDGYTGEHCSVVLDLCEAVGEVLGVEEPDLSIVKQVALLHDIGKVGIPDAILQKEGPLAEEEWVIMQTHPEIGRRIVEATPSLGHLGPGIGAEHERWDGRGYPDGLKGEEIPLESRIVLACDAWHAMTSDRPYRKALSHEAATEQIVRGSGSQFDPQVVEALLFLLKGQGTELALNRHRHDRNNLSQLIRFERYLDDGDRQLKDQLRESIGKKLSSLRLSRTTPGDPAPKQKHPPS